MDRNKLENLPLEWIRVFEAAGRTGSFTAAANECGLTQAAVSQRIRNLEQKLDTGLFSRQARGVTLSIEGEAWLPHVSTALNSLSRSTRELFGNPLKKLTISASTSVTQLWIIPRLVNLENQSRFQISLTTMNIEADFAKTHATIDIRYGDGNWHDKKCKQLFQEVMLPLCSKKLMRQCEDWRDLPRISYSGPRPGWQEWAAHAGDTQTPAAKYRFDNFASALSAANAGLGVVLASMPLANNAVSNNALVQLSTKPLTTNEGYWMTSNEKLTESQWEHFTKSLCSRIQNNLKTAQQ